MSDNLNTAPNFPDGSLEKTITVWHKRDTVFAVMTLVASVPFADWSVFGGFNAGFTVSFIMLFVLTAVYILKLKKSFGAFSVFCGLSSAAFSVIFLIYNNSALNTLFFVAAVFLYGIFVSYSFTERNKNSSPVISSFDTVIVKPFDNITAPFVSYKAYRNKKGSDPFNRQVLLGIALSVPILFIILPLLIHADAAFEGLISAAFSKFGIVIAKILLGAALAIYLFSMLFAVKNNLKPKDCIVHLHEDYKRLAPLTAVTLSSVLSAVYLAYLLSQSAYFSGGFSGILPEGYTFSFAEYARRGFFELCAVCTVNLIIVFLIMLFAKQDSNKKLPFSVRLSIIGICVFSLVFTATAISKMFLYISFYGLTRLRLLTSIFMIALALLFILIILSVSVKKIPAVKCAIVCFAVIGLITGFCDVDRTVAGYNVSAYKRGALTEIDIEYLSGLSDSAVPYIAELADCKDEAVKSAVLTALYIKTERLFNIKNGKIYEKTESKPSKYNYSRERAKDCIRKNIKSIAKAERERRAAEEENFNYFYNEDYYYSENY